MLVEDKKERIVILLRHGESRWNNDNRSDWSLINRFNFSWFKSFFSL